MKPSCHFFLHVIQDWLQQLDDQQHSTASESRSGKKEPAIKDKTASAKMPNVGLTVFVFDAEQTIRLLLTSSENDDFIRVTSKKEKREMKEQEKHRQQEKQRKAEEEENKKKQHSTRKSSHKIKHNWIMITSDPSISLIYCLSGLFANFSC